jgi:radical SAM superfamily enzyme YgiQ (UPF0313 family)
MRQQGEVLLISCYELGHQPLGLASPLAFLELAGFAPASMDISIEAFNIEKVKHARFVGISVPMHTALCLGVRVAEQIRGINSSCHICFYGLYASLNAEYLLERFADSVIGGEFEKSLTDLIQSLAKEDVADALTACELVSSVDIEGVSRRGRVAVPLLKRLPFAVPSRKELPPLQKYAQLERDGHRELAGYVETSRGCLHHCLHCPIPSVYHGRFFVVPKEIVLEDIRQLVQSGVTHLTFGDPDFLNGPGHSLRIARAAHQEFPQLTFDFTAKVEHLLKHRASLAEFAELGCLFVVSAFESMSNTVLANLEKGHSRDDIYAALEMFREIGMALRPTWIPFTPWTTLDDYIDILECLKVQSLVNNVDPVQYTIRLLIPPGSGLLHKLDIKSFLGAFDQTRFTYHWHHPDPRMDELHAQVSDSVEKMTHQNDDAASVFNRVCELAYAAHDRRSHSPIPPELIGQWSKVPRMTEPWFC